MIARRMRRTIGAAAISGVLLMPFRAAASPPLQQSTRRPPGPGDDGRGFVGPQIGVVSVGGSRVDGEGAVEKRALDARAAYDVAVEWWGTNPTGTPWVLVDAGDGRWLTFGPGRQRDGVVWIIDGVALNRAVRRGGAARVRAVAAAEALPPTITLEEARSKLVAVSDPVDVRVQRIEPEPSADDIQILAVGEVVVPLQGTVLTAGEADVQGRLGGKASTVASYVHLEIRDVATSGCKIVGPARVSGDRWTQPAVRLTDPDAASRREVTVSGLLLAAPVGREPIACEDLRAPVLGRSQSVRLLVAPPTRALPVPRPSLVIDNLITAAGTAIPVRAVPGETTARVSIAVSRFDELIGATGTNEPVPPGTSLWLIVGTLDGRNFYAVGPARGDAGRYTFAESLVPVGLRREHVLRIAVVASSAVPLPGPIDGSVWKGALAASPFVLVSARSPGTIRPRQTAAPEITHVAGTEVVDRLASPLLGRVTVGGTWEAPAPGAAPVFTYVAAIDGSTGEGRVWGPALPAGVRWFVDIDATDVSQLVAFHSEARLLEPHPKWSAVAPHLRLTSEPIALGHPRSQPAQEQEAVMAAQTASLAFPNIMLVLAAMALLVLSQRWLGLPSRAARVVEKLAQDARALLVHKLPWLTAPSREPRALWGVGLGVLAVVGAINYFPLYADALQDLFSISEPRKARGYALTLILATGAAGALVDAQRRGRENGTRSAVQTIFCWLVCLILWTGQSTIYYKHLAALSGHETAAIGAVLACFLAITETLTVARALELGDHFLAWLVFAPVLAVTAVLHRVFGALAEVLEAIPARPSDKKGASS